MLIEILVRKRARREGVFEAWLGDELLCTAKAPFLDSARVLLKRGVDPEDVLEMVWENGTRSLRGKVGVAAGLAVAEGQRGPKFVRWRPDLRFAED